MSGINSYVNGYLKHKRIGTQFSKRYGRWRDTRLHYASPKVSSVVALFVRFGGLFQLIGIWIALHKLPLVISVVFPIIMSHSLLWRHIVLLTVGVYSSNHRVLYTIGISMTRKFQKSVGPSVRLSVCNANKKA